MSMPAFTANARRRDRVDRFGREQRASKREIGRTPAIDTPVNTLDKANDSRYQGFSLDRPAAGWPDTLNVLKKPLTHSGQKVRWR
jgi:hypothetical protein